MRNLLKRINKEWALSVVTMAPGNRPDLVERSPSEDDHRHPETSIIGVLFILMAVLSMIKYLQTAMSALHTAPPRYTTA